MKTIILRINEMDCAEEVTVLKKALLPFLDSKDALAFDLLNRKLTISLEDNGPSEKKIREAIRQTGMQAESWNRKSEKKSENIWQRKGRMILCAISGAFLVFGFVVHAYHHGILEALVGGETSSHPFPQASIGFYLVAVITGGWFVFPKAFYAVRRFSPDMNLLMTAAVIGALVLGEWFEAGTVSFLFALALLLESWSVDHARRAIESLLDLSPTTARYFDSNDGKWVEKRVEEVSVGVTVVVRPGEKIPLDGTVTKGATSVNQAPITGESIPVEKQPGDEVYAGTLNNEGAFEFRVTKPANDTTLARIIHMVEEARSRRAPSEQWVQKFARYYTPIMMLLALAVAIFPPMILGGEWQKWFYEALVILVIACPCALVISTPVSIVVGLASAARTGVLIKGGAFLEMASRLKVIAMDKTGTLTMGEPELQEIIPFNEHTKEQLLAKAAALEANSEHPLSKAILNRAKLEGLPIQSAEDFQAFRGKGVEGIVEGQNLWLGSHRFMEEKGKETPEFHAKAEQLERRGFSVIAIGTDDHVCGLMSVTDSVRGGIENTIRELKAVGIERIVMLTGDHQTNAAQVAQVSGVDEFYADLLPEDKVHQIETLVEQYGQVAMVGDGINDAPALAASSLGIAMGATGTDAAIETADIALMSDDLSKLPWLIRHSRRTRSIIYQNVFISLGLKTAVMGLVLFGTASLWMAIAADMGASFLVIFNALRLLKVLPDHTILPNSHTPSNVLTS